MNTLRGLLVAVLAIVLSIVFALANDPPDSEENPQSGHIETVDSKWESSNWNIRHVVDPGQGKPEVSIVLTGDSQDDLGPRIAIDPDGDTWVVWWRDDSTDEVLYRKHDYSTETWSSEDQISSGNESSSNPEIVLDADSVWVVFEIDDGSSTDVAVDGGGRDSPEPFPGRTILATTSFSGEVDALAHAESGHLWMTWVDSTTNVGWREYDYTTETWDAADFESYASDTVEDARGRIRDAILGS